ncbi:DUF397 domain-containing protein [Streptosporangium sp. NBC_01755]|uniref:DUF397 domain-containing protein n=1 Tax=unclassified Streptosporangium TaxID=2632669 RepID=UPI002DDAD3EB|nr:MULTISPECIES: DUF397 domain-containing protein [unclassified Streptosporangium]WSA27812.1 DUF397 domain-containing protein [Streptosporangium sp. NBC_01810]WSD00713.1 DUF397 domain-containing protein [Streptosporangium sp. NBC_01755]
MDLPQPHPLAWRKSSYSGSGDNCVEVAALPNGGQAVRDSKNPTGPVLKFSPGAWNTFISGIKDGRLG